MSKNLSEREKQLQEAQHIWNAESAVFDEAPDHGLRDPHVRAAWTQLLRDSLPKERLNVLDIGCGTGSLSLVLAELGHTVTGTDLSPAMIAHAEAKARAAQQVIPFHVMDAAFPAFAPQQFDAIVCRHLLWMLPEIDQVLQRWLRLLTSGGQLLLIEGFWHTNVGLHSQQILDALPTSGTRASVQPLSHLTDLWGHPVDDERYSMIVDLL